MENYFNLISEDISDLAIIQTNPFDCILQDKTWKNYNWFILATSQTSQAYTICDIWFHQSSCWKFKPRLIFRRTNKQLQDKSIWKLVEFQRIPFEKPDDWYNEFRKMIWFLNSFRELVDIWEFNESFSIVNSNKVIDDLNNIDVQKLKSVLD